MDENKFDKYDSMTNNQINHLVAEKLCLMEFMFPNKDEEDCYFSCKEEKVNWEDKQGPIWTVSKHIEGVNSKYVRVFASKGNCFTPCIDPAIGFTIMHEFGIGIDYDGISWTAHEGCHGTGWYNDSWNHPQEPLRLAMIIFLEMKI